MSDKCITFVAECITNELQIISQELAIAMRMEMRIRSLFFVLSLAFSCALRGWAEDGLGFSGTLPVLYIQTESPVVSKEDYVSGTCYIDATGISDYESLGTADEPCLLQIKGHGNYTWKDFEKKPYRLKFDKKVDPLGMGRSRHFILMAGADDNMVFLRNSVGFELSRRIGLAYTPRQEPVEVVLNGDYIGLYMLTEKIRVEENRVNIVEQSNWEFDPEFITGGWLVEIDNYIEEGQVVISEVNDQWLRFSMHSPEELSDEQRAYITALLTDANEAIYAEDKSSTEWEQYIDMDSLVCFYIVNEIMDNAESFHGSCYIHKHLGEGTKLIFGPVWDFGNSFCRSLDKFIYQDTRFHQCWIGEIARFPRFLEAVEMCGKPFFAENTMGLFAFIDDFVDRIEDAVLCDARRWPEYGTSDIEGRKDKFKQCLTDKIAFLGDKWGIDMANALPPENQVWYSLNGQRFSERPAKPGLYVRKGRKVVISGR